MKQFILCASLLLTVSLAQAASAAKAAPKAAPAGHSAVNHGPAGCGLGSILFKDKDGLAMQVLAATFNASSGNQTFAMSTGSWGCEDAQTAKVAGAAFIEGNKFALANDVARGGGETLDAYLALIGAANADRAKLQKNYKVLFELAQTSEEIDSAFQLFVKS